MNPKVSIIIPVYNGSKFIQECAYSILEQQFGEFEAIFINDMSTDDTYNKLVETQKIDKRFRIINSNSHNLVNTLNIGLHAACGSYIARMDIDDKMNPNRLSEQVNFMDNHLDIIVCSSWAKCFGLSTEPMCGYNGLIEFPLARFLSGNYIIHPTVMIRKEYLIQKNIQYKQYPYAEDYQLWIDIAKHGGQFWTLPMELLQYRVSESQVSNKFRKIQYDTTLKIKNELLEYLVKKNFFPDKTIIDIITNLAQYNNKGYINADTIFSVCQEILLTYNLMQKLN